MGTVAINLDTTQYVRVTPVIFAVKPLPNQSGDITRVI